MCFSRQPEAPVNKPSYAPEDAHKHFEVTEDGKDLKASQPSETEPQASPITGPKLRPTHDSIRM